MATKKKEKKEIKSTVDWGIVINFFVAAFLILCFFSLILTILEYAKEQSKKEVEPICPGKTLNEALAKNQCNFYKVVWLNQYPQYKNQIESINCSCESLINNQPK